MNCDNPSYIAAKFIFGEYICMSSNESPVDMCCSDPLGTSGPYCVDPISSSCQQFSKQTADSCISASYGCEKIDGIINLGINSYNKKCLREGMIINDA
jgi:hypothetical protein